MAAKARLTPARKYRNNWIDGFKIILLYLRLQSYDISQLEIQKVLTGLSKSNIDSG